MADVTVRNATYAAAREIKASAHYSYMVNGGTLDGSKFTVAELVLEGQCLVQDDITKKYEKYADGNAAPALINGQANITPAVASGINAGTSVKFAVNGIDFVISNAILAALTGASTEADIVNTVKAAVSADGTILDEIAAVQAVGNKLKVATDHSGSGQEIKFVGTWGVAGDQATIEGIYGLNDLTTDKGAGAFPEGKSNPVILDESIKFVVDDVGANPDVTFGQAMVHGAVYEGMAIGCTDAFKAELKGSVRFVTN